MNKILILASLFLIVGCAGIGQQAANVKACASDPVCLETARKEAIKMKEVGRAVGDAVPFPSAPLVAGCAFYGVALIFNLAKGGAKKRDADGNLETYL